jgi:homoserine dehydrogenase
MKNIKLGLFGFGVVGHGLYQALNESTGFKAAIKKICVRDRNKKRDIDPSIFTFDKDVILEDPEIDVVVELIDDAEEAFKIVKKAMENCKHVVTSNKKMVATNLQELLDLQRKHNVGLLYEGSACGSIPIIRTLEEYFDNEDLIQVSGIFNGTTNYILSKTIREGLSYPDALRGAQELGFAESDPTNDVEAYDAKYKAIIVALHAFGFVVKPEEVLNFGITTLCQNDLIFAREKSMTIKLTPIIRKLDGKELSIFVMPSMVPVTNHLFKVENEFNGVIVEGMFSGEQFFQGRGAGSLPTGSAVLSDISALSYDYRYEYKKNLQHRIHSFSNNTILNVYLRFDQDELIDKLKFESIETRYYSTNHNYVVGKINLQNLIQFKEELMERKLFFALME